MKSKTLETSLFTLSAGCLVISIYEIISRGIGFGYFWLMLSIILWIGYTFLKRRRRYAELEQGKGAGKGASRAAGKAAQGKARGGAASKTGRKRT